MKSITQTKFWQLPVDLRLVVIWFFLLGLYRFWKIAIYIEMRSTIGTNDILVGIVCWILAIGLCNRSNESREWAAFFVFLGSLVGLFGLAIAIFEDPNSTEGFNFSYDKLTQTQTIIFLVAYLILNTGILVTLLRPSTKVLFTLQALQGDSQWQGNAERNAKNKT